MINMLKRTLTESDVLPTRASSRQVAVRLDEQSELLGRVADQDQVLRRLLRQLEVMRTVPSTALELRERAVDTSVDHILADERFADVQVSTSNRAILRAGLAASTLDGAVAEFGVYKGESLTTIAQHFTDRTVHGFDSFEGLPEEWGGTDKGKGAFSIGGQPPDLPVANVAFHVGFFDQTVPPFAADRSGPFAFVHLDADLYSSTRQVFDVLGSWFVPGTIIVFDEYFGYHGWQRHEHRAFTEFLAASGLDHQPLGVGHMNLAVRLVEA